ncbi:MAG: glycosyltransferase family 4 protein [Dehalococcoidia bacterium]
MNIVYVYDGDWPRGATRVVKQTRSLADAGHDVHLVSRNETRQPRQQTEAWMTVHRLPAQGPNWANRIINFPYFFNPFWIHGIYRAAKDADADCIIVADLPLALTALWVGRVLGLPVHYDMAEVYPEFLRGLWAFDQMSWSDYLVRNPAIAERLERFVLPRMDTTFVVSEESRDRCNSLGVDPARLVIVGNTPENPERLAGSGAIPADLEPYRGRPVLLFVGILIGDRGLKPAITAMTHLIHKRPDALLVVVGDGPDRARLESLVTELGLHEHVIFLGWKDHAELPEYYAQGHIGLLPFLDGSHVRITLANKLFDYMGAGLPVIASDLPPMRRVVEECRAGVLVPAGDPEALAAAAHSLLSEDAIRSDMGHSGRSAVLEKYRWERDEARFLATFEPHAPRGAVDQ